MHPGKLGRLLHVRRYASEEAKQNLADAIRAEQEAASLVDIAGADLAREAALALSDTGGDHAVEAYIGWLPKGRKRLEEATLRRSRAMAEVALARATLAVALSSEQAAASLLEVARDAERLVEARRESASLDEIAARSMTSGGGPRS